MSPLVAAAMAIVLFLVSSYNNHPLRFEQFLWLFFVSVAGCWTILIPAKIWEGTQGETVLRCFFMMVLGLGLGVLAYALGSYLLVELPSNPDFAPHHSVPPSFFGSDGQPLLPAFVAAFGALFFIVRWWRQANPLRCSRVRLWSLLVSIAIAGVVAYVLDFPQPWLPMLAAAMSVSIQFASPWRPSPEKG